MDVDFRANNLDWSHQIKNPKTKKKERSIIFMFVQYNLRNNIFKNNKLLKETSRNAEDKQSSRTL